MVVGIRHGGCYACSSLPRVSGVLLMPGRGPVKQERHTRARNDAKSIQLVSDGKTRGPAIPRNALRDKQGNVLPWHPQTIRWWNNWRKSPQAIRMMTGPDWDFLLDTALMHHQMWQYGRWELAAEVRLRVQKFGATPEDRARLGLEVGTRRPNDAPASDAPGSTGATVSSMEAAREQRLLVDEDD
jgi:hypothetical protein